MNDEKFMRQAIELSKLAVAHGNEPFGAVLVKDDEVFFRTKIKFIQNTIRPITGRLDLSEIFAPKQV